MRAPAGAKQMRLCASGADFGKGWINEEARQRWRHKSRDTALGGAGLALSSHPDPKSRAESKPLRGFTVR
jgi:hypothetical protein